MEIPNHSNDKTNYQCGNPTDGGNNKNSEKGIRILSVDRVTVEKIVFESCKSRKVLLTKSESSRIVSEQNNNLLPQIEPVGFAENGCKLNVNNRVVSKINEKRVRSFKNSSKIPVLTIQKKSGPFFSKVRISPVRLTKISVNASNLKIKRYPGTLSILKHKALLETSEKLNRDKVFSSNLNPQIEVDSPPNKEEAENASNKEILDKCNIKEESLHNYSGKKCAEDIKSNCEINNCYSLDVAAHNHLENCQNQIEKLQQILSTKVNFDTIQIYKQKLPGFDTNLSKILPVVDCGIINENATNLLFDKDFLDKLNFCKKLKIEESGLLETNFNGVLESEKNGLDTQILKNKFSKQVSELEKKWSEDLLKNNFGRNSSESSKSSYIEETGSLSSCEGIIRESDEVSIFHGQPEHVHDSHSNETSSIRTLVEEDSSSSTNSFLNDKKSKISKEIIEEVTTKKIPFSIDNSKQRFPNDGYANLIHIFTMEGCSSKSLKEEKKKKGFRRLLPGIFSPKDSHKTHRKDLRERKRRDDKYHSQYQQNGNYSKSTDTMKLNEDIRRNVQLNSSLNSSMTEERLHEIKQDLFSPQGIITSTPDHFLQSESNYSQGRNSQRHYTPDSSFNFVSPEEEWLEQNIISGSPDMRKLQNSRQIENERQCNLERKHSFQEPVQSCFIRNHGPSGRISAPPSERYLIRSRVVHPIDRPLPAIPQRIQFINENRQELRIYPRGVQQLQLDEINYQDPYSTNSIHDSRTEFYSNNEGMQRLGTRENEIIDTSINQTQVQVHQSRQMYVDDQGVLSGRAPKYSPNSSRKSEDYADSSYTPNSSQKSEFSPSSSKSGEYYLNSPHASDHASLNSSGDRNEIITEQKSSPRTVPYPRTQNGKDEDIEENIYDETPTISLNENYPTNPCSPELSTDDSNLNQESSSAPKGSPNIPMSSNLSKLHANVEDNISKDETIDEKNISETGLDDSQSLPPDPREKNLNDIRALSPSRIKRVTSPLTIIPPASPTLNTDSVLSLNDIFQGILKETVQEKQKSPSPIRESMTNNVPNQTRSPSSYSNINQSNVISASPRKSQPGDQILIASPKRDMLYDSPKSYSKMKSERGCPESPIPIVDSPSQLLDSKQSLKHIVAERAICPRSPGIQQLISESHKYEDRKRACSPFDNKKLVQNLTPTKQDAPSSLKSNESAKQSQYQDPIYGQRIPMQRNIKNNLNNTGSQNTQNGRGVDSIYSESKRAEMQRQRNQSGIISSQMIYSGKQDPVHANYENIYARRQSQKERQQQHLQFSADQNVIQAQKLYDSSHPQSQSRHMSPSKKETMHHLETFFWQQKALDAQKKPTNSSTLVKHQSEIHIEAPEVRDAVYWQKLKKLDEEQQRRFYEQNQRDERNDPIYWKKKLQSSPSRKVHRHGSAPSLFDQNSTVQVSAESHHWENKIQRPNENVVGKPPIMGQKGQNQPVLVVRPQPVAQERTQKMVGKSPEIEQEVNRCHSASPRFAVNKDCRNLPLTMLQNTSVESDDRGVSRLVKEKGNAQVVRKPQTPPIYEEEIEIDTKPPPIFKRGSLISNSNSSIEYGTMGPKRVSFSNQANCPNIGYGKWPTKHGMAPEPPTRRNKEDEARQLQMDNLNHSLRIYGNVGHHSGIYATNPNNATNQPRSLPVQNVKTGNVESEYDANRPLPPPPRESSSLIRRSSSMRDTTRTPKIESIRKNNETNRKWTGFSESESGSEAGEIQGIFHRHPGGSGRTEGEGANDLSSRRGGGGGGVLGGGGTRGSGISGSGGGSRSRDEPRRHTLSGDHQPSLHHQQFNSVQQIHPLHPHHLPPAHSQYGTLTGRHTMDLEMGTKSRQRKVPFPRGYPPPSSAMLFDDDPGIMSEVETSSTGFRRGGKQRSSLPVVRTPSKTLERPLGLVFLQYRNETKRALLPNEITSIDTVKALFVRSFPKQLTMEYLDSPHVKVYIHDSSKDMFYELEDLRSHLRDIRDRSVLRLFESSDGVSGMPGPLGAPAGGAGLPPHWEDQSYFSEPEFDSEFQHQHIHKSKNAKNSTSGSYYMGGSSTLPRGGPLLRAYSPATPSVVGGPNSTPTQSKPLSTPDRIHEGGYMSSPERGSGVGTGSGRYPPVPYSGASSYEDPYYSQYSGTVTPVIDEEARLRVENMERQLANLTGIVQKALIHPPHTSPSPRDYLQIPAGREPYTRTADKSVSFEKSVSFSDEPPDMNSPKQHSPQHAERERERHKPTPPPKPVALATGQYMYGDLALAPEMYNQLRVFQKKAKELNQEKRNLRRMAQAQAHTVRESIRDSYITIRAMLMSVGENAWAAGDSEKLRLSREEDLYKQEMLWLEKDLTGLESTVEELRGNVINRKTRVNMSDVENMALILNKASKTVADLKVRFPNLQEGMKGLLSSEMEKVMREEKFLKEEPERLESVLKRCKKLTGTLVTLKRLASVQEQRLPNAGSVDAEETPPITPTTTQHSKTTSLVPAERTFVGSTSLIGGGPHVADSSTPNQQRPENALDALLDELQTFSRPASQLSQVSNTCHPSNLADLGRSTSHIIQNNRAPNISDIGRKGSIDSTNSLAILTPGPNNTLRRLHSYPSSSDTDTSPPIARLQVSDIAIPPQKPPVPERNAELLQLATARRVPPPPPPRTSSRSPLASPTSPQLPPRNPTGTLRRGRNNPKDCGKPPMALPPNTNSEEKPPPNNILSTSNSSSCESVNSQEGIQNKKGRHEQLEQRHQELLRRQKVLQEQYTRLQQFQNVPPAPSDLLKKTGSESNLLAKMGLGLSTTSSGSLTSLASKANQEQNPNQQTQNAMGNQTTTNKIYETDIL